ncbi:unnamed protein product [Brachionus calyciflorus]|uniref:SEA domain-containing protein n=1 Tax=Brachionus calyciflorus TaxID=104777 RepID=A0A813WS37_9BILA|nr:unnamed protein product [Brachionus calyciflorus]
MKILSICVLFGCLILFCSAQDPTTTTTEETTTTAEETTTTTEATTSTTEVTTTSTEATSSTTEETSTTTKATTSTAEETTTSTTEATTSTTEATASTTENTTSTTVQQTTTQENTTLSQNNTTDSLNNTLNETTTTPLSNDTTTLNNTTTISSTPNSVNTTTLEKTTIVITNVTTTSTTSTTRRTPPKEETVVKRFEFTFEIGGPGTRKRSTSTLIESVTATVKETFAKQFGPDIQVFTSVALQNLIVAVEKTILASSSAELTSFSPTAALDIMKSDTLFSQIATATKEAGFEMKSSPADLQVKSIEIKLSPDGSVTTTNCPTPDNCTTSVDNSNQVTVQSTTSSTSTAQQSTSTISNSLSIVTTTAVSTKNVETTSTKLTTDVTTQKSSSKVMTTTEKPTTTRVSTNADSSSKPVVITTAEKTSTKNIITTTKVQPITTKEIVKSETTAIATTKIEIDQSTSQITTTTTTITSTPNTTTTINPTEILVITDIRMSGGLILTGFSVSVNIEINGRKLQIGNEQFNLLESAIQNIIKSEFPQGGTISAKDSSVSGEKIIVIDITSTSNSSSNTELGTKLSNLTNSFDTKSTQLKGFVNNGKSLKVDVAKFEITATETTLIGGVKSKESKCSKQNNLQISCSTTTFDKNGNVSSNICKTKYSIYTTTKKSYKKIILSTTQTNHDNEIDDINNKYSYALFKCSPNSSSSQNIPNASSLQDKINQRDLAYGVLCHLQNIDTPYFGKKTNRHLKADAL